MAILGRKTGSSTVMAIESAGLVAVAVLGSANGAAANNSENQTGCHHGNSNKPCKVDPQSEHGNDCTNPSGGNQDHCADTTTTTVSTQPSTSTTISTVTTSSTAPAAPTTTTSVVSTTGEQILVTVPSEASPSDSHVEIPIPLTELPATGGADGTLAMFGILLMGVGITLRNIFRD